MRPLLLSIALLTACTHSDAVVGADPPPADVPFDGGHPRRLTFDAGMDLFPSWSPDGQRIAFSFQPPGRADYDRCIGILPGSGGTRRDICYSGFDGNGRTDALEWPVIGEDGALLYTQYFSDIGTRVTGGGALRLATLAEPLPGRVLLTLPKAMGPISFNNIGTTRWLNANRFYFVPQAGISRGSHANPNKKDTMFVGVGLIRGDLVNGQATFTLLAGTDSASGFDFSAGRDTIYFTRQHETRLYAMAEAGGPVSLVYDKPSLLVDSTMLRNPTRVGNRIAMVFDRWDVITGPQGVPARGLMPGIRLELVRPGLPGSEVVFTPSLGQGIGAIAAAPGRCEIVFEARRPQQLSYTTDLYSICAGSGAGCACP